MPTKQVIVCRTKYPDGKGGSFGVRFGKLAAQVAHASGKVFFDRDIATTCHSIVVDVEEMPDRWELYPRTTMVVELTPEMASWLRSEPFTKVVLGVESEDDLLAVHAHAKAAGLPTALVQDVGTTEFHGVPTYTTCAVGPAEASDIDKITGPGGLVPTKLL